MAAAAPRSLSADNDYEIRQEIIWTEGMLLADVDAADLAPRVAPWYTRLDTAVAAVWTGLRSEILARAMATVRDTALDDKVTEFGDKLLASVKKDRTSSRWTMYFKIPVSKLKKLDRRVEAATVTSWIRNIRSESDPALQAFADPLSTLAQGSTSALDALASQITARQAVVAREWEPFVEWLDAQRSELAADLTKRGNERQKPRGWADRFFLVVKKSKSAASGGVSAASSGAASAGPAVTPHGATGGAGSGTSSSGH